MGVGKSTFAFSNSSITIDGGSTTIGITRDNQSYSHKLLHGYGDIATLAVGTTSYTYKPTASALTKFFQEVPAQKSRLIDIYLDTYNGSTKVGRDVHALTVTLSEATGKPSISGFSITDSNTTANGWGVIVYGKSSLTASATPSGKYGATISRNVFTCTTGGKTYESYYINDLIASLPLTTTPTSFTFGYKSTDSRGFSNTVTIAKTVAQYQAPHIDTFEVIRCDASGNESDTGTKAKVVVKGSWAAMKVGTAYKNGATLKVGYKTKTATSYTYQTIAVSAGTVNVSQLLNATLDVNTDYEFSIQLADSFETYSETDVGCSNVKNILYVSADGEEIVIGTDTGNNVTIDSDSVDIRRGSEILASFSSNSLDVGNWNSASNVGDISTVSLCGSTSIRAIKGSTRDRMEMHVGDSLNIITATNAGIIRINDEPLRDWVVAEGTSGIWYYRKWASGRAECFGRVTKSTIFDTAFGSMYLSTPRLNSSAYPITFTEAPMVMASAFIASGLTVYSAYVCDTGVSLTSNAPAVYAIRPSKKTDYIDVTYNIYAIGRWE